MTEAATPNLNRAGQFLFRRSFAQVLLFAFAFLLPFLNGAQAIGMAILVFIFCALILPSFEPEWDSIVVTTNVERTTSVSAEAPAGKRSSLVLYSLSLLVLTIIFPHHSAIIGAAWGISALGDVAARMVGQKAKGPRLAWNPAKTWAGSIAFGAVGALASLVALLWIESGLSFERALVLSLAAALVGATAESLPVPMDDNLAVPLVSASFLFCASFVTRSAWDSNLPYLKTRLWLALGVTLIFAFLAFAFKTVTRSGALAGFVLSTMVYLGYGYKSFAILLTFFILSSLATRLGYRKKKERGIAERRGGKRTWREAIANGLAGACCALLVITTHWEKVFLVAFVASFAEAAGDTVASEIGQWLSPNAYLITNMQRVEPGENGAVSSIGTLAGLVASAWVALTGLALGLLSAKGAVIALVAAFAGNLLDSLLGATAERKGFLNNGLVNFACTSFAAGLALSLAFRFRV